MGRGVGYLVLTTISSSTHKLQSSIDVRDLRNSNNWMNNGEIYVPILAPRSRFKQYTFGSSASTVSFFPGKRGQKGKWAELDETLNQFVDVTETLELRWCAG